MPPQTVFLRTHIVSYGLARCQSAVFGSMWEVAYTVVILFDSERGRTKKVFHGKAYVLVGFRGGIVVFYTRDKQSV